MSAVSVVAAPAVPRKIKRLNGAGGYNMYHYVGVIEGQAVFLLEGRHYVYGQVGKGVRRALTHSPEIDQIMEQRWFNRHREPAEKEDEWPFINPS